MKLQFQTLFQHLQNYSDIASNIEVGFASFAIFEPGTYTEKAKTRLAINYADIKPLEGIIAENCPKIHTHQVAIAQSQERANISQTLRSQLTAGATAQKQ
ncbi:MULTISPECIES: hypothetical protein [unclassified Anabaena]|uniref:hypothetical protein n=1 Tax=unclassified Anabaena TaxID=2619674 RepID=UPI000834ABCA|nr:MULTISPECIES: hypothetical protein [unclassified Anabaena]